MRIQPVVLLAGVLAIAVATGCGGSEAAAPAIGKAAFIKKATAICEATREKMISEGILVFRKIARGSGESRAEVENLFDRKWLIPTLQAEIEALRSLGAPSGDEAQVNAILDALQEVNDEFKADPEKFRYEQGHFSRPYQAAEARADEYGVSGCGHP